MSIGNVVLMAVLAVVLASQIYTGIALAGLRRKGIYPPAGQACMADVLRLKRLGLTGWAMRCYREIHSCSLRQAREALERLG